MWATGLKSLRESVPDFRVEAFCLPMHNNKYPEEYMSAAVTRHYLYTYREIEAWLQKTVTSGGKHRSFKKVTFELTEEQLQMARKRGVQTNGNTSSQSKPVNNSGGNNVRWINVTLDNADAAFLAESTASFSELAAMACELVAVGFSLTVKPMDGGDSVMACIVGKPAADSNVSVGLSGFAANVRDALLVLCYKYEDKLGGQLPVPDALPVVERPRFR